MHFEEILNLWTEDRLTQEEAARMLENDLVFLGLMAMEDPPRPEVAGSVDRCHRAGIRLIMISGDYGLTAEAVARQIGLVRAPGAQTYSGADLNAMDEAALHKVLGSGEVILARVAPEHKLRIVLALQQMGHVVAMTGDGVNDGPALKQADIWRRHGTGRDGSRQGGGGHDPPRRQLRLHRGGGGGGARGL
jgi:magnesium-transporting ATPase (P-type)